MYTLENPREEGGGGGGSSDYAKTLEGVNAFRTLPTGGSFFLVLLHFYLQVFSQICLSPMFPLSHTYLPCVYLWLAIYGWNLSVVVAYYLSKLTHCFEMNLSAEKMKTLPSSIAHKI